MNSRFSFHGSHSHSCGFVNGFAIPVVPVAAVVASRFRCGSRGRGSGFMVQWPQCPISGFMVRVVTAMVSWFWLLHGGKLTVSTVMFLFSDL